MNKWLKIILLIAVIALVGYKSIYLKKLSDVVNTNDKKFDARAYASKFWTDALPPEIDSAVDLEILAGLVSKDRTAALEEHSNLMGIGNNRYALVKTTAIVTGINDDELSLRIPLKDSSIQAIVAMEFIYGNAIRDASGLVDLKDFPVSADLNSVSEEINNIVRTSLVPSFRKKVKPGDRIEIAAAIQLNTEHIKWDGMEMIPVRLKIMP